MKKMDEMDRNIQLRSEEFGYKTAIFSLAVWTLFNCWQTLMSGTEHNPLPVLLLCLSVCVQNFSQMAMKHNMTAGDEEYHEPNKLLRVIIGAIVITAVIITVGTYFLVRV